MYRISKAFKFSASHIINGLPDGHKCARLHGHNYEVIVTLESPTLDDVGFIVDYGDLSDLGKMIYESFDHRHLNDVVTFNPTSENLARFFYDWVQKNTAWSHFMTSMTINETEGTSATYNGS